MGKIVKSINTNAQAEAVIAALLGGDTYAAAAKKAGVAPAAVQKWLREDWFTEMYRNARRRLLERCIDMLASASSDAVRVLQGVINDTQAPHAARVSASARVLDVLLRGLETLQIDERLARLEKAAAEQGGEAY